MATWHQQRNPVQLFHATKYTVVTDPPGESQSVSRFDTDWEAENYLDDLVVNNPRAHRYSYILPPGGI